MTNSLKINKFLIRCVICWLSALGSTLLISLAPYIILFFIPIDNTSEYKLLLKVILSFASGCLLGDIFFQLIPHALMARSRLSIAKVMTTISVILIHACIHLSVKTSHTFMTCSIYYCSRAVVEKKRCVYN